jgi:hypothetical protein
MEMMSKQESPCKASRDGDDERAGILLNVEDSCCPCMARELKKLLSNGR